MIVILELQNNGNSNAAAIAAAAKSLEKAFRRLSRTLLLTRNVFVIHLTVTEKSRAGYMSS